MAMMRPALSSGTGRSLAWAAARDPVETSIVNAQTALIMKRGRRRPLAVHDSGIII